MNRRSGFTLMVMLGLALVAGAAVAEEATLISDRDNTLYEVDEKSEGNGGPPSNGAGDYFFAGRTAKGGELRRGVVHFDVAAEVPAGATITSAQLVLEMSRSQQAGAVPVSIHVLTSDWGEGASDAPDEEGQGAPAEPGDATWIHTFFPGDFWNNPGGDFVPTASATRTVDGLGSYTWGSTAEMVADAQAWLDNPADNFGYIVLSDLDVSDGDTTAKRFNSRQNPNGSTHPMLILQYNLPVPASPPWALLALALALLAGGLWLARRVARPGA